MKDREWNVVVPLRNEDEEDATEKQLGFIKQLFITIGYEPLEFQGDDLGKWQASALIDQLIDIRDNGSDALEVPKHNEKQVSLIEGLGIFVLPYVFAWLILRKGHSFISRLITFGWLAFSIYIFFIGTK